MTIKKYAIAATLLLAPALMSTEAAACISCNYTPEVVFTPVPGQKAKAAKPRTYAAAPVRKAAPERKFVAAAPVPRKAPVAVAAAKPAAVTAEAEKKSVVVADAAQTETSPAASAETTPAAPASTPSVTAALEAPAAASSAEPAPASPHMCSRFLPTVGVSQQVPCEQ